LAYARVVLLALPRVLPAALLVLAIGCRRDPDPATRPASSVAPASGGASGSAGARNPPVPAAAKTEWITDVGAATRMGAIAVAGAPPRVLAAGSVERDLLHSTATAWQLDDSGRVVRTTAIRGTTDVSSSEALGVAIDAQGNALAAGFFAGTLDLPSKPTATSASDGYVVRMGTDGAVTSFDALAGPGLEPVRHLGFASDGWVAAGGFEDRLRVADDELRAKRGDVFLLKVGATRSLRRPAGLSPGARFLHTAHVDASGNLAIAAALMDEPRLTVEIASLGADGNLRWARRIPGVGVHVQSMVADPTGDLVVCGSFATTLELGPTPLRSSGSTDVFVAKLDARGDAAWVRAFASPATDDASGCALDPTGNVYAGGDFRGPIDFGKGSISPEEDEDGFVVSMDPEGRTRWARAIGGAGVDAVRGVAVARVDAVYVTGVYSAPLKVGADKVSPTGKIDAFVAKIAPPL
jgi:hypothetical protein